MKNIMLINSMIKNGMFWGTYLFLKISTPLSFITHCLLIAIYLKSYFPMC